MMTPEQLFRILWARRMRVYVIFAAIVGVVLLWSLLMPKTYVAATSIVVDFKSQNVVTGAASEVSEYANYLATQADIIASHNVALKVVDTLKLADNTAARRKFLAKTGGAGSIRDWLADELLKDLDVIPGRTGSVIVIKYASHGAQLSAKVANAFADGYLATNLELMVGPAKRQAAWFEDQVQALRKNLEASQTRLSDYQSAQGIVGATERLDVENVRLSEISSQLVSAQAALLDAESRRSQIATATSAKKIEQLPEIRGSSLLQGMKVDVGRAETKLSEIGERYGPSHPDYQSQLAEVTSLRGQYRAEIATATGSIQQAAQIAAQRDRDVQGAFDAQKAKILRLKGQQNQYDVMAREVDSAQHAYDAALQRTTEVQLQSRLNQASAAVLNPAVPPLKADHPNLWLNVLVSIVLGSLVGVFAALMAEIMDRHVRANDDLISLAGVPLLGVVPRLLASSVGTG